MAIAKIIEKIKLNIFYLLVSIFPVFFLTNFPSAYLMPKFIFLITGISLILILWVVESYFKKSIEFKGGRFDVAVILFLTAYLVSTFTVLPSKYNAFLFPGTTTFIALGSFLYFLGNQLEIAKKKGFFAAIFISGVLVCLTMLLVETNSLSKISQLPGLVKDKNFNPVGGYIPSFIYLLTILPLTIGQFLKEKEITNKIFIGLALAVVSFGLTISVYKVFSKNSQSLVLPSLNSSWQIALEAIKQSPFFGVGPGNYLTAYSRFRPVTDNYTTSWNIKFADSRNYYLTLATETGLVGVSALSIIFALVLVLLSSLKLGENLFKEAKSWNFLSLLILLLSFFFFPANGVLLVLFFLMLSLNTSYSSNTLEQKGSKVFLTLLFLIVVLGLSSLYYFGVKAVKAEILYKKSLDLVTTDAIQSYNKLQEAIKLNPKADDYRLTNSQLSFALASKLSEKKDPTEEERNVISQLIQQSIAEAKVVVSLNPFNSNGWAVLGSTYMNLINFAKGSDQFAIQSYTQAITLDPINPNLRLALGGLYYTLKQYDEAAKVFELAVLAKQDLPNSYYNLAMAYREQQKYDKAIEAANNLLKLISKDSKDYDVAKKLLDELQSKKPAVTTESTDNLQVPTQESNINTPVELTEESQPPATPQPQE